MSILALAIYSLNLMAVQGADDPKPVQPTKEQLEDAKEAYAKFGAKYEVTTELKTKQTSHRFVMPTSTTDAELKGLPDLPFSFGLNLSVSQVTDAGLKELKQLKQLNSLELSLTEVTDAGLKELQGTQKTQLARTRECSSNGYWPEGTQRTQTTHQA